MIHHAWTVVCEKSITDKESNNISLDVLEQLTLQIPPIPKEAQGVIFPYPIEIVSLWYRALGEEGLKGKGRVRLIAPNAEEVANAILEIDLTKNQRVRAVWKFLGLPIPKDSSGYFFFITELEQSGIWVEVSRVPLELVLTKN